MKRGALNFLGRKNQSLFDTNVKMKDMDNVELVLESSAIPESGTASVRARPTVKHLTSSTESFQGFAVPTPKVPLLPPVNGPKINGSGDGDQLSNGSYISVPDLEDKEIFVPPPPSVAPPPPPGSTSTFIPPPPDFMGDLNTLDLSKLQRPSMPAPNPPSMAPSVREEDLYNLKPPPMAPPKPPSTSSGGSSSSTRISNPPPATLPKHPKFAPPEPPSDRQQKTFKTPPPKPIRLSSISNTDSPPQTPAPPPPVQTPTLSTFNPQNTAKLYNIPKTSVLGGYEEHDTRPKQMLVLEDSGSAKSSPVLTQVDGKAPRPPSKPAPKDPPALKRSLPSSPPPQAPPPEPVKVANKVVPDKPLQPSHQTLPKPQRSTQLNATAILAKPEESSTHSRKFSPLLDHKLRNLKSSESNGAREGHTTSPLALLMAAKEREKHRSTLSRENSASKNERPSATIQPSESSPNSFTVTPRSSSSSSLPSADVPSASPVLSRTVAAPSPSPSASSVLERKPEVQKSPPVSQSAQLENTKELRMPVLPPPPEFGDFDDPEPPPSISPPDPPAKKRPSPSFLPPAHIPPPPPKPGPPVAPKLPPPDVIKPKPLVVKPKVPLPQLPPNPTSSQATLQSILQKKMLEMDKRITPTREADSSSDDWGAPTSEEDHKVPVIPKTPKATPQTKSFPRANQSATLDMRELEGKVASISQETSAKTATTSNGTQSRHPYGMTFTVRPGTKQPITLVSKGE